MIIKDLEFILKKIIPEKYLLKKRIQRSIKKGYEKELEIIGKFGDKSKDAIEDKAQFADTDCNTDNQGFTRITHTKTANSNNVFITSCAGDTKDDFVKDTIAVE